MNRTLWCGNLSERVTQELLHELFLQAAPLERVILPSDKQNGRQMNFAFIVLKHEISVDYTIQLLNGTRLFDKPIMVKLRNSDKKQSQAVNPPNMFNGCSPQMLQMVGANNPYSEWADSSEKHDDYQYRGGGGRGESRVGSGRRYDHHGHNYHQPHNQNRRNHSFNPTHRSDRKPYNDKRHHDRKRSRQ